MRIIHAIILIAFHSGEASHGRLQKRHNRFSNKAVYLIAAFGLGIVSPGALQFLAAIIQIMSAMPKELKQDDSDFSEAIKEIEQTTGEGRQEAINKFLKTYPDFCKEIKRAFELEPQETVARFKSSDPVLFSSFIKSSKEQLDQLSSEQAELRTDLKEMMREIRAIAGPPLSPSFRQIIETFNLCYLGTPEQPVPFGGRDKDLKSLDSWLNDPKSRHYLLLAAPAGRGKSALLVR